jgi:hypothetical protein
MYCYYILLECQCQAGSFSSSFSGSFYPPLLAACIHPSSHKGSSFAAESSLNSKKRCRATAESERQQQQPATRSANAKPRKRCRSVSERKGSQSVHQSPWGRPLPESIIVIFGIAMTSHFLEQMVGSKTERKNSTRWRECQCHGTHGRKILKLK